MDLKYSDDDLQFKASTHRWLVANKPAEPLITPEQRLAWHRKLYEAGFVGMGWPKAYGGRDASVIRQAIAADEMAKARTPLPINPVGVWFVGPTLIVHGTEAQRQRYLTKILTAEEMWCQLYSEPDAGSDLASLRTTAVDRGDHFVVSGQKTWTSGGLIADRGLLLARTDATVAKHKGISCFLIDMRQPGVEVRPLVQITGGAEFAEVFLTEARVDKADLVGHLGEGWGIAQTTLAYERGASVLARVTHYAWAFQQLLTAARTLTSNGWPLLDDPLLRGKLGQVYVGLQVQRCAALRMLSALDRGASPGAASSIVKLSYSEFEKRLHESAQEILGPWAQLMGDVAEDFLRLVTSWGEPGTWGYEFLWSRAGTIYAGSSEIQKNVIADRVLGLPREPRADRVRR